MAGIDFSKILADTETYKDDMNMTFKSADGTPVEVQLGALRNLNASERQSLTEKISVAQAREAEINRRDASSTELSKKAQQVLDEIEKMKANTRSTAPGDDPFADPWLAPVKAALDKRDNDIAELKKLVASGQSTVAEAAKIFLKKNWKSEYGSINFGKSTKKPTQDELVKYAATNKLVDEDGIPSISRAWEEMSKGDREADLIKEAEARGEEKGRIAAMAARVLPPGVPGSAGGPAPKAAPPGELGDLYSQALQDPELRRQLEELGAAGIPMA
jgi:hypothetical protein